MFFAREVLTAVSRDFFVTEAPSPYQLALLDEHERLSSTLASVTGLIAESAKSLQRELAAYNASEVVSADSSVQGLYAQLGEIINSHVGQPLEQSAVRKLRDIADEIRIRMVSVSLVAGLNLEELSELLILDSDSSDPWKGSVIHGIGGVTHASVKGFTTILFSPITSVAQCHDLLAELSNIFDRTALTSSWIFDFSAVEDLPVILLGSLLSYQRQLESVGKELLLCWAKPKMFPAESLARLTRIFRLVEVGGHLFSCPRNALVTKA